MQAQQVLKDLEEKGFVVVGDELLVEFQDALVEQNCGVACGIVYAGGTAIYTVFVVDVLEGIDRAQAGDYSGAVVSGIVTVAKPVGIAARGVPGIKPGSAGGATAGQRFPESVRDAAKTENPTATCVFCNRPGTGTQVDHAIPRARDGNATLDNAQLACPHCNASKGAGDFPKNPPPGYVGPWPP